MKQLNENNQDGPIEGRYKHSIVCFCDIQGFTHWTNSPLYSNNKFRQKVLRLYSHFVNFKRQNEFFVKLEGDGLMSVVELNSNRSINKEKARAFVSEGKKLVRDLNNEISVMDLTRPGLSRIRFVTGDTIKLQVLIKGVREIDYIGPPVNLAFNLLAVRPDIPFLAHETVEAVLDLKETDSLKAIHIEVEIRDYKGVGKEDLLALRDFESSA